MKMMAVEKYANSHCCFSKVLFFPRCCASHYRTVMRCDTMQERKSRAISSEMEQRNSEKTGQFLALAKWKILRNVYRNLSNHKKARKKIIKCVNLQRN